MPALEAEVKKIPHEIEVFVVDNNSPAGTAEGVYAGRSEDIDTRRHEPQDEGGRAAGAGRQVRVGYWPPATRRRISVSLA